MLMVLIRSIRIIQLIPKKKKIDKCLSEALNGKLCGILVNLIVELPAAESNFKDCLQSSKILSLIAVLKRMTLDMNLKNLKNSKSKNLLEINVKIIKI